MIGADNAATAPTDDPGCAAATSAAVPPMLAPMTATRGMPVERRYRTAACTSRHSIAGSVSPCEHPASPPGQ